MKQRQKSLLSSTILSLGACVLLSACQTAGTAGPNTYNSKIDTALNRAASSAAASGHSNQSLAYLEKIYKRNSEDPTAAINYAAALRQGDYFNQAKMVLMPFANDKISPAAAKVEYAALHLAMGNYDMAEDYAKKAILQDEHNPQAYHYLAIALDSREMYEEAERAFRKALDHWKGDPTSIMNNLALNLASQGFYDESINILRKAQAIAPYKMEIERNIRIVTALQQSEGGPVPKPAARPKS